MTAAAGLPAAWSCEIIQTRTIEIGPKQGFEGRCSNNDAAVTCTYEEGGGWSCQGPQGGYSHPSKRIDPGLIANVCGCEEDD